MRKVVSSAIYTGLFVLLFCAAYLGLENYFGLSKTVSPVNNLEKKDSNNDKCIVRSLYILVKIYSEIGSNEIANKYHKILEKLAKNGNKVAMVELCFSTDSLTDNEKKLHFCQAIIDSKSFDHNHRLSAFYQLLDSYYKDNKWNEIINLCDGADPGDMCLIFGDMVARKLEKEKKYEQLISLYEKIGEYDYTGITQSLLADIYLDGKGTMIDLMSAINWYEKSLKNVHDEALRAKIMNNMCVAYERQNNYVIAFRCYKQAAVHGYSISQLNLAIQYAEGHGTIQDYQEAYAWISVAIAQGLGNEQEMAEKNKNWLTYNLRTQDKTGTALSQAKELAQNYYKKYVLHEKSVI